MTLKDDVLILVILAIYVSKFSFWKFIFDLVLTLRAFVANMSYAKILAFGTPNPKIWASWGVLYLKFFCNMLQCNLKFKSTLFTNLITYIIFLFMMGPLYFLLTFFFLPSVSLFSCPTISPFSLSLLHVTASLFDKTQARALS